MDNSIQNKLQTTAGIGAGIGTYYGTKKIVIETARALIKKMDPPLKAEQIEIFKKAAYQIYNDYGFKNQGVEIFDISKEDFAKYKQERYAYLESFFDKKIAKTKNPIKKLILKFRKNSRLKAAKKLDERVLKGNNAYYTESAEKTVENGKTVYKQIKKVIIDMDKRPEYLPHEFGHTKTNMNKAVKNLMMKIWKNPAFHNKMLIGILGISLLTNPEKKNPEKPQEHKNPLYPVGLFIKNNCGKLMTLALLPSTFEEGLASLNGHKMAKNYLDKANIKKLTKSHILSFSSYLVWAAGTGAAVYLANKVRDKIIEHKCNQKTV